MSVHLIDAHWDALLGSWSCDYCEPQKSGLRAEIDALIEQYREPTDAECPVTNPERDSWRRIVEAQRKDIADLARQLSDATQRAAYWQTIAENEDDPEATA